MPTVVIWVGIQGLTCLLTYLLTYLLAWRCRSAGGHIRLLVSSHGGDGLGRSSSKRSRRVLPQLHRPVNHSSHRAHPGPVALHQGHVTVSCCRSRVTSLRRFDAITTITLVWQGVS